MSVHHIVGSEFLIQVRGSDWRSLGKIHSRVGRLRVSLLYRNARGRMFGNFVGIVVSHSCDRVVIMTVARKISLLLAFRFCFAIIVVVVLFDCGPIVI